MRLSNQFLAAAALCLSACAQHSGGPASSTATTEADAFSRGLSDAYVVQQTGTTADKVGAASRESLLQDFERLKAAAATEQGRADSTTREAIELQRLELLAHAGAIRAGVYAPPSDVELKTEYDRFAAGLPATEFRVAHILVANESMAHVLITRLQAGADFANLARENSADDSKAKGGDMGWISPGRLPADFTTAVQALKPGQFTLRPVHTIYGWHVIKLLVVRSAAAPPYEQVKAQLLANIQQQRYEQFLEAAVAEAASR